MLRRFWVALEYCDQNKKKREGYIAKCATQNDKITFEPKMPTIDLYPKSENIGQMCICAL